VNPVPRIRLASPADKDAIRAIQSSSPEAAQWEVFQYFEYEVRVAEYASVVAGFLAARTLAAGESEILNLAVAPEFRGRGIGRALLRAWMEEAAGTIYLEVRSSNQAAQKFYKSLGFEVVVVRPQYYSAPSESAIVMKFHSC
jgi:[ribosomal protein S18]-alanine N-acetyltransferase